MATPHQTDIDDRNAAFWSELCGTRLARDVGIPDTAANIVDFDRAYLEMYPYLERYLPHGGRVLEVGLGSGTVGHLLAQRGCDYHGLDIAAGPVEMMRLRLEGLGHPDAAQRVQQGSALQMPHPDESFDHVVTIGCLHHTGDLPGAISEVRRVLAPGGRALVMLYNRNSFRQRVVLPFQALRRRARGVTDDRDEAVRASYDTNLEGQAAPFTEFVSRRQARRLFTGFRDVRVEVQNFDELVLAGGRVRVPRARLLGNLGRVVGLDLYITAQR